VKSFQRYLGGDESVVERRRVKGRAKVLGLNGTESSMVKSYSSIQVCNIYHFVDSVSPVGSWPLVSSVLEK